MSIHKLDPERVRQQKIPFTQVCNYVVQNISNSFAYHLWSYLLSLPYDWEINTQHLMNHFKCGRKKINQAKAYLHKCRLIEYAQDTCANGQFAQTITNVLSGEEFINYQEDNDKCTAYPKTALAVNGTSGSERLQINNNKKEILDIKKQDQKILSAPDDAHTHFESFWSTYPLKKNKVRSKKIWERIKGDEKVEEIVRDVQQRMVSDQQWQNKQFIPHPSTYLGNQLWEDEIVPSMDDKGIKNKSRGNSSFSDYIKSTGILNKGKVFDGDSGRLCHGEDYFDV